jgi:hypothetical protein
MTRYALALVTLLFALPALAHAHTDGAFLVYSTAPGGGSLVIVGGSDEPIHAELLFCGAGRCLFENDEGSIRTPNVDDLAEGLYALTAGTKVRAEIVSVDAGAALKIGSAKLDQPGESTNLGTAHSVHAHPIWQIEALEGEEDHWSITFRVTTGAAAYADSEPVPQALTNHEGHEPTTTTTSSTTSTSLSTTTSTFSTTSTTLVQASCGDPDGDGATRASDALYVLAVAVGVADCPSCVCNVDSSVAPAVTGADALRVLLYAVGSNTDPLICPACDT